MRKQRAKDEEDKIGGGIVDISWSRAPGGPPTLPLTQPEEPISPFLW